MKDAFGREIKLGDKVVVTRGWKGNRLDGGTVVRVTERTATVAVKSKLDPSPFAVTKSARFMSSRIMIVNGAL